MSIEVGKIVCQMSLNNPVVEDYDCKNNPRDEHKCSISFVHKKQCARCTYQSCCENDVPSSPTTQLEVASMRL